MINESELEYTLERGLPLAEAHDWIVRPTPVPDETVALSAESRREMAPVSADAAKAPMLSAAEASRVMGLAATAFGPIEPESASGLDPGSHGDWLDTRGKDTSSSLRVIGFPALAWVVEFLAPEGRRSSCRGPRSDDSSGGAQKRSLVRA